MTAFLGDIVNYTTLTGNVVTAQVVCTEFSYSPGRWENKISREARAEVFRGHDPSMGYDVPRGTDVDGDIWVPTTVPPVKEGRVHLKVTAPNGNTYVEFNVPPDPEVPADIDTAGTPGTYHRVDE